MPFQLFDPGADIRITAGNLPHWYQPGVTYFVTFRTDDSVPVSVANDWYARRDAWLQVRGIDPHRPDWAVRFRSLPDHIQREFHATFSRAFMAYLDQGLGASVLKRPDLARIVADALHHFDGQRYHLGDYVVMPNHVHVLVCLVGDTDIERQCSSWKRFTATRINRAIGAAGRFWHEESFDHLVRNTDQFEALERYIAENPMKAGLHPGEYLHWRVGEAR